MSNYNQELIIEQANELTALRIRVTEQEAHLATLRQALYDCTTSEGSQAFTYGGYALVRRLREIDRIAHKAIEGMTLDILHK